MRFFPKKTAISILLLLASLALQAQDPPSTFKAWGASSLRLRISPKTSVTASQLSSFETRPGSLQFVQANLAFSRRLSDRWNLDFGFARSWFKSSNEFKKYQRLFAEVDFRLRWGQLALKQSLRAEYHFPQLRKYRARLIYSNKLSYRFKELPLRPTPFIRQQVYWYQGGRPVTYFEDVEGEEGEEFEEGEEAIEQAPNGLHRYRLTLGLRTRLAKYLYATVFYTWQREFNGPFAPYRQLNVPTESGRSVQAPFNNYSLIGLSLSYSIKLYKKRKNKK